MSHAHAPTLHGAPPLKMGLPIPNSKLGMWLFLGTEIMFFTAFIGTYIVLRLGSGGWPNDPNVTHIRIWAGGLWFYLAGILRPAVLTPEIDSSETSPKPQKDDDGLETSVELDPKKGTLETQIQYTIALRAKNESAKVQVLPDVELTLHVGADGKAGGE